MGVKRGNPVVLFDGHCLMCSGSVRFIYKRDKRGVFRFAAQQSAAGQEILRASGWGGMPLRGEHDKGGSLILVDGDQVWSKSDAVLRIAGRLGFPWWLSGVCWLVPGRIRDAAYAWVARNRYRWFGRSDACFIPDPLLRERFVE